MSAYKGANAIRGALGKFIFACREGLIPRGSALIVESLDRLSRQSPRKTVRLLTELLDDYGIEVHVTMAGKIFRPQDEDGVDMIIAVAMAMKANTESEDKSDRIREAFAEKRKEIQEGSSRTMAKAVPWWLINEGTKANRNIIAPGDRAAIVRRIFKETADGSSSNEIAWQLNEEHIPTWRPKTKYWMDARVRDLIRSDAPLGHLRETRKTRLIGKKWIIKNYYPRIVSDELAADARNTLVTNRKKGRPTGEIANLLKGVARYRGIWIRFTTRKNSVGWNGYYDALTPGKKGLAYCISANQLEGVLLACIPDLKPEQLKTRGNVGPSKEQAELDSLEVTIQNMCEAIEGGSTAMIPRLVALEKKVAELKAIIEKGDTPEPVTADANELEKLKAYTQADLKDLEKRKEIARTMRRVICRIDLGVDLADISDGHEFPIEPPQGGTIIELPVADPTGSRGRKNLTMLVHFFGGAQMAIARIDDSGWISTARTVRAGDAMPELPGVDSFVHPNTGKKIKKGSKLR